MEAIPKLKAVDLERCSDMSKRLHLSVSLHLRALN